MEEKYMQKEHLQRKVLIIGDRMSGNQMKDALSQLDSQLDIHGPLGKCGEAKDALSRVPDYNLIFSSFSLEDGDVLDVFRTARPRCYVIFYSPCDSSTLQSVERLGISYATTSPDISDIVRVTRRIWIASVNLLGTVTPSAGTEHPDRILAYKGEASRLLMVKDILYFRCDGRKTHVVDSNGEEYLACSAIGHLESVLSPAMFFRVSRQYLANASGLKDVLKADDSRLRVMLHHCPDRCIFVSRARCAAFRRWCGGRV